MVQHNLNIPKNIYIIGPTRGGTFRWTSLYYGRQPESVLAPSSCATNTNGIAALVYFNVVNLNLFDQDQLRGDQPVWVNRVNCFAQQKNALEFKKKIASLIGFFKPKPRKLKLQ